jgi:mono/diheme cytochrome c family protein
VAAAAAAVALIGNLAAQQATAPRRGGNPEAAKVKSPIASSPESIAAGRQTYQRLCARCHGFEGKGDGGGAGAGGQPADFTDAVWEFGASEGEVFFAIKDGTSADMESYADRLKDPEIWNLVNYIRSLSR